MDMFHELMSVLPVYIHFYFIFYLSHRNTRNLDLNNTNRVGGGLLVNLGFMNADFEVL